MTTTNQLTIAVTRDRLRFGDGLEVTFQRTLRIPDDGKEYPLPPGLGTFPLRRIDDLGDRIPAEWRERGGIILPMYQREAMWLCFHAPAWKPRALKVAVGKVCAITGKAWSEELHQGPQDYVVAPHQPWLDGIAAGQGFIRQFVAMPLGLGYTVEGQVSGEERCGGLQLKVFEPRAGRFPDEPPFVERMCCFAAAGPLACAGGPVPAAAPRRRASAMGLAAGGRMRQKVYPDPHGLDTWDPAHTARIFVHLVNSELWRELTGERPPRTPVTAREYARHGLPWFDLYDEHLGTVAPQDALAKVKSVKELDAGKSALPLQDDEPVAVGPLKQLKVPGNGAPVRDGEW
ncbi:MAG: hypothetical protein HY906_12160 [Deltaproteobacteria bacterium]|nr:hypothetical protein [Deltaproteobacteria bacterium]